MFRILSYSNQGYRSNWLKFFIQLSSLYQCILFDLIYNIANYSVVHDKSYISFSCTNYKPADTQRANIRYISNAVIITM